VLRNQLGWEVVLELGDVHRSHRNGRRRSVRLAQ
jgi:hypothetical protein